MSRFPLLLLLIGCSLGATACRCGAEQPDPIPEVDAQSAPLAEANDALAAAMDEVGAAVEGAEVPDLEALERHFDAAVAAEDNERVMLIMASFPRDGSRADTLRMEIRGLQAMGRVADARSALQAALLLTPEEEGLAELMGTLWASDPAYNRELEIWESDTPKILRSFHGSSSIIFEVIADSNRVASFKPSQTIRRQYYRAEVATDVLSGVLELEIRVPVSREVQIGWDAFHGLAEIEPGDESFHETNAELIWFEEDGDRFLRGVSKVWLEDLERFPVEYTDAWHHLLDGSRSLAWLDETSIADALTGLQGRERDHYETVTTALEHATSFSLATQLSDLHVLDVLINNYDRYQPEGLQLGMNCHVGSGLVVSVDNGAGFPTREDHDWRRVRSKVEPIQWFSRSTYLNLVSNDPRSLRAVLFPPSDYADQEDDRYDYFVERWEWMVEHIESLIEEHGEENVLVFP